MVVGEDTNNGERDTKQLVDVFRSIVEKLQKVSKNENALKRYINQVLVFSRLRGLLPTCSRERERKKAEEDKAQVIKNMLVNKLLTEEQITIHFNVSLDFVKKVQKELKK